MAAEDEEDMGVIETYSNYKPSKLKVNPVLKLIFFLFTNDLNSICTYQYSTKSC